MKTYLGLILAVVFFSGAFARGQSTNVYSVAVMDFEAKDGESRDMGQKVATLLNANLSVQPQLILVERAELDKALGEQEMGLSGTISAETVAKVGNLTGAKVIVTGRVFRADKDLFIVAKIIGTETSRVYGALVKGPAASASISDLSEQLAEKIAKLINDRGTTLVANVESREQHIDRIVKSLKEGKRPTVSVLIKERHFGGAVIDPAAQTELAMILQKAGFTVIDEKASERADVEITGEAFSAFGLRKGNLISCRSRIELKAHERLSGKILDVDSQSSVAVDIAEQSAAKTALENAAIEISGRLLPKLIQ